MSLGLDLRTTWRALVRRPAYSVAVVATLGVAVAANVLVFELLTGALWRPLPFREPDGLIRVWEVDRDTLRPGPASLRALAFWNVHGSSFGPVAGIYRPDRPLLLGARGADDVRALKESQVSVGFFDTLGVQPRLGRGFKLDETRGGANVAVISDRLWRQLGSDPMIVGRHLARPDASTTVLGVMPPTFDFPSGSDLWTPLWVHPVESMNPTDRHQVDVIARLRPGAGLEAVNRELATLGRQMAGEFPATYGRFTGAAERLQQSLYRAVRPALAALYVAVALLFVGSLSSGIGLVLARSDQRHVEWQVRLALGATRWRLARLTLLEMVVLSTCSALLGLSAAALTMPLIARLAGEFMAVGFAPRLHAASVAFTAGLAAMAAVTALAVAGASLARTDTSHLSGAEPKRRGWIAVMLGRDLGYVCQVMFAATSLLVACVAVTSFIRLYTTDGGFATQGRVVARLDLTTPRWREEHEKLKQRLASTSQPVPSELASMMTYAVLWDDFLARVLAIPEVHQATIADAVPLADPVLPTGVWRADAPEGGGGQRFDVLELAVGSDYFRILGIPLRRGRLFATTDGPTEPAVVVVNEAAARLLWPVGDPIGRRLRSRNRTGRLEDVEVVGVIGDTRHSSLASLPEPQVFWSIRQDFVARALLLCTVDGAGQGVEQQIRGAARAVGLTAYDIRPYEGIVSRSTAGSRVIAILMSVVAGGVLLLTVTGVYGAVAQSVARRSREMAIRAAVGAASATLTAHMMRWHVMLAALGVAAGVGFGWTLIQTARASVMPGLNIEPVAVWVGVLVPLVTVLLAGGIPAWRMARGELLGRLRDE